jgi:hypothetical protein
VKNVNKMEKNRQQNQEASLTDAYSLFVYAIRTKITRDYYPSELIGLIDFIICSAFGKFLSKSFSSAAYRTRTA